jgi:hypothetical protein
MWIIPIILVVFILLAFIGLRDDKKNLNTTTKKLKVLENTYNITASFTSTAGFLAFNDEEKKLYYFRTCDSKFVIIKYSDILECQNISSLSFYALTPNLTQYLTGELVEPQRSTLVRKLNSIISDNTYQAKEEYNNIVSIPLNAIRVQVKQYVGWTTDIPLGFDNQNTYMWTEDNNIFVFSMFGGLRDFKERNHIYKPIIFNKQSVVDLSQEGNIHYTTDVSGGGGGGSSVKGAIIGGILAGDSGAIIGSRKSTAPISTTTQKIDDRATHLKTLDASNSLKEIIFDYNDYYAISRMLANIE